MVPKKLTHEDVIARLRKLQAGRSLDVFAKEMGVSASYLSDVYRNRRGLGIKILSALHLVADPPTYSEVKQ